MSKCLCFNNDNNNYDNLRLRKSKRSSESKNFHINNVSQSVLLYDFSKIYILQKNLQESICTFQLEINNAHVCHIIYRLFCTYVYSFTVYLCCKANNFCIFLKYVSRCFMYIYFYVSSLSTLFELVNVQDRQEIPAITYTCTYSQIPPSNRQTDSNKPAYFNFQKKGIHIAFLNIQHLMPKLDEIKFHFKHTVRPDICGFCETFLTENTTNAELNINGYSAERKDRVSKKGGGLVIYIAEKIPYKRRTDLEINNIESIWIEITYPNTKSFLINYVYRPPNSKQSWIDEYEIQLDLVDINKNEFYILGDFNINYYPDKKRNMFDNTKWSVLISKFGLRQFIQTPTRVTKSSEKIIDHLYTNKVNAGKISNTFVPDLSISDHYPICFSRYVSHKIKRGVHKIMRYRSFKNFNELMFQYDLLSSNMDCIETIEDPNIALNHLSSLIRETVARHAPFKEKRIKHDFQPKWFTDDIKKMIFERDKCHKNKQFEKYKVLRNKVTAAIRKSKRNFFNNAINEKTDSKHLWRNINDIANLGKSNNMVLPDKLIVNNQVSEGMFDIINELNKHFVNISNIVDKVEFSNLNFAKLKQNLDHKLKFIEFNIDFISALEVKQIIDKLDSNKATGLDEIGPRILKHCGDYITPIIANIINNSIKKGIFPECLKSARVLPIYKSGDKNDPSNYRPISILCTLSKIFEKHVAIQLQDFFKKTNIIHKKQSGFRKHHSCNTALTHLIDTWLKEIDSGKYIGSVFLDLRKAFDLVDHQILINKLKLYHFSDLAVQLFKSYLSNRTQVIQVENYQSNAKVVTSGVPQGSILGPLLFLIYINDLADACPGVNLELFADDSTLYKSGYNLPEIESNLQENLTLITRWCKTNNMLLHPTKSKCMLIGSRYKLKSVNSLQLFLENVQLENVSCQKLLGICIDNNLKWDVQIDNVCKNINSKINLLKKIKYFLNRQSRMMFYNGYILPIMDYCCHIWGKENKGSVNKIIKLQLRVGKIILDLSQKSDPKTIMSELKILSFNQRCQYHAAVLVYKTLNNMSPNYMSELLKTAENDFYNLRSQSNKQIMLRYTSRTNYFKDTFQYYGMKIWNAIPINIRNSGKINTFKSNYKKYLSNNYT